MYRSMLEAANEIYADYLSSGDNKSQVASKGSLQKLREVIQGIRKEDFGISDSKEAHSILFSDAETISYANIHSEPDERFSFGLFFIPKGGQLPLHDHPNMFVFSKILMGNVKRLSFSLQNREVQFSFPQHTALLQGLIHRQQAYQLQLQQLQLIESQAKLTQQISEQPLFQQQQVQEQKQLLQTIEGERNLLGVLSTVDSFLTSEEILGEGWIDDLDPSHSNLHSIEALSDCVFFDVLLPHYDLKSRFCNYYKIASKPNPTNGHTVLQIMTQPLTHSKVQYFTIDKNTCSYFN